MNGYQQPQYYTPYKKNNLGLIIGGLAIAGIAGGYLYFAYKNGWWPFGAGGIYDPDPQTGCTGACNYSGSKRCKGDDLCECVNNQWTLFDQGSSLCGAGATTHLACYNSQTGLITCVEDAGPGNDTCNSLGYSYGCPCNIPVGDCDTGSWCNPSDSKCIKKANNTFISGTQSGTLKDLYIDLEPPFAANKMNYCRINFAGGGQMESINWSFWAVYNGVETMICDGLFVTWGGTGYFWIPQDYAHENWFGFNVQGMDGFRVKFDNTNAYPTAFQGTFMFG